ncbi:response regulator [Nocardiopsis changdeensis]|uniref:Response regulator transcription factor n=1 Tax=Nocardiopsis changdeensis TaxID=2831969 RepID=A0ABX8BHT9_9ACTN|nr:MULTISPECIES: response regulator transcription factor [Nocardiopsis]QUX21799.1 response regulator transcription factor [Nocardiopsis changdeensis]QYX37734.1 response regulator transcription factor [Nocardiopsis sp. MT53]
MRVLVVDDDIQIIRAMTINLRARGHDVDTAADGAAALRLAADHNPDVVLLDLGLPDMEGLEVIRRLRGWSQVPIIVLSARHSAGEKVRCLDSGADDYVTKPFGMDELLARMRAAERRSVRAEEAPVVRTDSFIVDLGAKRVVRGGEEVRLTPTEWHILEILARNAGQLVSQRRLLHDVWGPAYQSETNYLRVYMAQLRRKLEPDPGRPRYLITEAGRGYRFENTT